MTVVLRPILFLTEFNVIKVGECIKKSLYFSCSFSSQPFKNEIFLNKSAVTLTNHSLHELTDKVSLLKSKDKTTKKSRRNCLLSSEEVIKRFPGKVEELSSAFNCSHDEAVALLQKYSFLTKSKMSTVGFKFQTLIERGISRQELLNDLWVLTYTKESLDERMTLLKELNLVPVKPWLLRCSFQLLFRMSRNRENNRLAMGPCKSVTDYLKGRLSLTDFQIDLFAKRYPAVMHVKVSKLKEIIDFLYTEGFTAYQIYQTPRILCHSLLTIQKRLQRLKSVDYELQSLALICKSERFFKKALFVIDKTKNS